MKKYLPSFLAAAFVSAIAVAGSIKVWSAGDVITAQDLNGNFSHIHNTMVGAHGARLVNSDVSASAGISHSKLATPGLLPRAWGLVDTVCSSGPCTLTAGIGITSVVHAADGEYTVTLSVARANAVYAVLANSSEVGGGYCIAGATKSTTDFQIFCYDAAGVGDNTKFQFMLMDDN